MIGAFMVPKLRAASDTVGGTVAMKSRPKNTAKIDNETTSKPENGSQISDSPRNP